MKPGPIPLKADTSIRPIKRVRYVYGSTSYGTIAKAYKVKAGRLISEALVTILAQCGERPLSGETYEIEYHEGKLRPKRAPVAKEPDELPLEGADLSLSEAWFRAIFSQYGHVEHFNLMRELVQAHLLGVEGFAKRAPYIRPYKYRRVCDRLLEASPPPGKVFPSWLEAYCQYDWALKALKVERLEPGALLVLPLGDV